MPQEGVYLALWTLTASDTCWVKPAAFTIGSWATVGLSDKVQLYDLKAKAQPLVTTMCDFSRSSVKLEDPHTVHLVLDACSHHLYLHLLNKLHKPYLGGN